MSIIQKLFRSVFKTRNERLLAQLSKQVNQINALEPGLRALSDDELQQKAFLLKQSHQKQGKSLEELLPEAFALVREASRRVLGLRHFDAQLIGGIVLFQGKIAEMRTGEGKTLVATLPAFLYSLTGKGVHLVTVNEYLVKRDAEWMRPIYEFLGLSVAVNVTALSSAEKKAAYQADVLYGTNNEFGFDYLRDNMVYRLEDRVQRSLFYAIIDEVDSILIDEARTPLIISGPVEESFAFYIKIKELIDRLVPQQNAEEEGDFTLDEKTKQAYLTEKGHHRIEQWLAEEGLLKHGKSLYDVVNVGLMHYVHAALRAKTLYHRDVDYIVKEGKVVIVDEHTGRLMPGRRWADGLHQATEAKEGVEIEQENQTLASITFQNYFRLYSTLAGMTGTADTEAYEFQQIYGLEVVVIPTNKPMQRKDHTDQIYLTQKEKFDAIVKDVEASRDRGQPVLVGTVSIEVSEKLSHLLTQAKVSHQVLNAKFHEKEAKVIAEAGRPGAVTIATNMAGRGTDIVLGGNLQLELVEIKNPKQREKLEADWQKRHEAVIAAGGLYVLGTERHESRRIDNQLRGRAGRQGDPGMSRFYLSLEDNLMRIFASDRVAALMERLGMRDGQVLESPFVTRAIENAQRKVEGHHFDIRKQLLEFDDVANDQRHLIYEQRLEILTTDSLLGMIHQFQEEVVDHWVNEAIPGEALGEGWDLEGLRAKCLSEFQLPVSLELSSEDMMSSSVLKGIILKALRKAYEEKRESLGLAVTDKIEKALLLQTLDQHWREHLAAIDHLRQGIHLRGYAQRNPMQEFKQECFELFHSMLLSLKQEVIRLLATLVVTPAEPSSQIASIPEPVSPVVYPLSEGSTSRNRVCECGSGKKYKYCHGKLE